MKIILNTIMYGLIITFLISCSSLNKCGEYNAKADIAEFLLAPIYVPIGFFAPIVTPNRYVDRQLSSIPGLFCFLPFFTLDFTIRCEAPDDDIEQNSRDDDTIVDYQPKFLDE